MSSAMNDEKKLDAELGDADDAAGWWTDAAVWGQGDDKGDNEDAATDAVAADVEAGAANRSVLPSFRGSRA